MEGCIDKIYESDRSVLEQYWYDDCNKMDGIDSISMEQAKKEVDNFYKDENFYIWRCNNKIVSMANYRVIDDQAKISHVYTPEEEEKKRQEEEEKQRQEEEEKEKKEKKKQEKSEG